MPQSFDRIIQWTPASGLQPQYGRNCMSVRFVLRGPLGAVQFYLITGWYHSSDRKPGGMIDCLDGIQRPLGPVPIPVDLGFHSLKPMYDGQEPRDCDLLPGGRCYYDGSGLNAEDAFDVFTDGGDEALWDFLERYYQWLYEDGPEVPEIGRRWNQERAS